MRALMVAPARSSTVAGLSFLSFEEDLIVVVMSLRLLGEVGDNVVVTGWSGS